MTKNVIELTVNKTWIELLLNEINVQKTQNYTWYLCVTNLLEIGFEFLNMEVIHQESTVQTIKTEN